MWREIRRILTQVAVTFSSNLQANRPIPGFVSRLAAVFALALSLCAHAVSAQDAGRVVPPDSAGYISRAQAARFQRTLFANTPPRPPIAPWEMPPEAGRTVTVLAAFDSAVARQRAEHDVEALRQRLARRLGGRAFALDSTPNAPRGLFGLSPNTADVSFDGSLQFQIGTTRQRNLACTPAQVQDPSSGCGGGFKTPSIDNTVQLVSRGIFAQRFHLNIDFDSKRDYSANNIISAWYQGLEDEKLRSVNIGTVQFVPPPSRFFTATIPTNNFGISAVAEFGPVRVEGIFATQKGSVVSGKTFNIGTGVVAPQDNTIRDLDYEADRFFWVVDPRTLPGYPTVDILNTIGISVAPDVRPADVHIYRYLSANQSAGVNANYDGITALAANGYERTGALRWRMLKRNIDYWMDPAGLWFVLAAKINPSDYLAVSYRTDAGTLVGSLPSTDNPEAKDSLQLIYEPNKGPTSPLFPYEMRQVYRVAGSSLVRSSLRAQILVSGSERPDSATGTFLSLLGLSSPSEQGTFDTDNRLFPRIRDPVASQVIKDALLVFPSVLPFSNPGLTSRERNDSLYVTPEYLLFTQGPPSKFQVHLQFDAQSGADRSSITLEALQITEGSEHITVNGQPVVKGKDYIIDYTTGRVSFLDPINLFGTGSATVVASFEQRGLFAQAPTTIAGMTASWNLGLNKTITLSGLYQAEATGYTRPPIGYEPRASLLVGVTGDFQWNTPGITRLLNHMVTKASTAPSTFRLSGEVAVSRPDPNRSGDASVEDFEDDHSIRISAGEAQWIPGSVPKSAAGLTGVLGAQGFDSAGAVRMIWQNLVPNLRDSITQLSPHDIDPTVALTQSSTPVIEPALWMTLHADTAGGIFSDTTNRTHWTQHPAVHEARWASMTTALSPTGTDLTRNDYFEFAMYQTSDTTVQHSKTRIVIDLGSVSEDALAVAPDSFIVLGPADTASHHGFTVGDTVYTGRQYVGVGVLNTERTFFGTWSATTDDNGILADRPDSIIGRGGAVLHRPALCADQLGATTKLYPWGDLGARCSNRNGVPDTEDLDGDNVLDAQGSNDNVFRYVIDLADSAAKYTVRSHTITASNGKSATWTIYRVPLRLADDTIGSPDMHLIKQMRMSLVAPADPTGPGQVVFFALALMKFTGAAWVARAPKPIATVSGPVGTFHGSVVVGTVSTQDGDSLGHGYQSPPGIINATQTIAVSSSQFSLQINEKSLSIQAFDLRPGERAEAYSRILDGSRNLLAYRQLRVWMHGGSRIGVTADPDWNAGRLQAYVKVGSDAYNFYMYRGSASTSTWDPEMVIDLQTWKDLRQQVEAQHLSLVPPSASDWRRCGGDSLAYVACTTDLAYMVQVRDPLVNPPNLAAVQELAAGIYYPPGAASSAIAQTELWVDDIRVGLPVSNIGAVGALNARLVLSDVGSLDLSGVYQNGNFHTLGQMPTYQNTTNFAAATTMHVEKFLPSRLGLLVPVSVATNYGWVDPQLLSGTDVETSGLVGLRRPRNDATAWTVSIFHPARPTSDPLTRLVLNPLSFNASGSAASTTTALSDASSSSWSTTLGYFLNTQRRTHPMHLKWLVSGLPRWLRESDGGRGVATAAFAPWPTAVQFSSGLSHTMGDMQAYQVPIKVLADTILKPVTSEQFLWRNSANVTWIPFTMLTATSSWSSTRDLRLYPDSTAIGRVANAEHRSLLGADVGVERDRTLTNSVQLAPHLSSWLAPSVSVMTNFILSRSLASRNPVRIDGDTAGAYILPQTLNDSRVITFRVTVDPRKLTQRLLGDSSSFSRALINVRPIEFSRSRTFESTFDLARFNPSLGYQLALGGFDSFLARDGQQAVGAVNGTNTSVTASVDLRAGFTAQVNYSSTTSDRYDHKSGPTGFLQTTGTTESWPSGRFNWVQTFPIGPIAQVTASTAWQRDRATSSSPFEDGTTSNASSETQRVTPDLLLLFRNGISVRASGEVDHSTAAFGGNTSQTSSSNFSQNAQWSVRMPRFLSPTRRSLITYLTVTESNSSSCIQRSSDSSCVPYYDLRRLDIEASFRALLKQGITAGLNFGYVHNDVRSLGQLTSTITIAATFYVPLISLGM
jgi:hypothetical protein